MKTIAFHVGQRRLLKLAGHLNTVPNKAFKFDVVQLGEKPIGPEMTCGTTACAIGMTPLVFPRLIEPYKIHRRRDGISMFGVRFIGKHNRPKYTETAEELFGITSLEAHALFTPGGEYMVVGLKILYAEATAKQVAKNIRTFVRMRQREHDKRKKQ